MSLCRGRNQKAEAAELIRFLFLFLFLVLCTAATEATAAAGVGAEAGLRVFRTLQGEA